ncbi:MAG: amidohydrolase family protein [Spirochaetales bacterium]|jgi:predicted TIM-barrel fold metal-dependent hydrolase|nr:amidohydrolase family protein [Spirochaetales bacterium]
MIIDAHAHVGIDLVFEEVRSEAEIIAAMDANKIDATIVQGMYGHIYLDEIRENHDRIARLAKQTPRRVFGMITMTPYLHEADFYTEARRCVQELGFVGMKLHPLAFACSPLNARAEMMWKVCDELEIPLMVHTGAGVPLSLPSMVIRRCKQFPRVPCVLAHCGTLIYADEAFLAAHECPNVFLETSWTAPHHIIHAVKTFGAQRVLFAADEIANVTTELAKYRSLPISSEERDQCLWRTANTVFRLGF